MSRWLSRVARLNRTKQPVHGIVARERRRKRRNLSADERREKQVVRDRDGFCRFPRCGCQKSSDAMKRVLTVSHDFHKGMGGDPTGGVSIAPLMLLLCKWRHQDGPVSRDKKTVRTTYLTPDQNDGPIAWMVDLGALYPVNFPKGTWRELAREAFVEDLSRERDYEQLTEEQEQWLEDLAEMVR